MYIFGSAFNALLAGKTLAIGIAGAGFVAIGIVIDAIGYTGKAHFGAWIWLTRFNFARGTK
jgi:hypothetical protein